MNLASPSEKTLAKVNDPDLWTDAVRQASREALESSGGKRSWHARAAQRASQIYKQSGGTWKAKLSKSQRLERTSLGQWEAEEWVTINPDTGRIAGPCGTELAGYEGVPLRCLPRERYEALTPAQRKRTAIRKADAPVGRNLPVMGATGSLATDQGLSYNKRCPVKTVAGLAMLYFGARGLWSRGQR